MAYRLTDPNLLESIDHHGDGLVVSLKNEVILLRALIEDRLNLAETPAERITAFSVITQALSTLTKLVDTLQKVEIQSGRLMPEDRVMKFVESVVAIVADELPNDPELIDRIVSRISELEK